MKKRNEVIALRAMGVSPFGLCRNMIGASLLTGILIFLLSETMVPYASFRSSKIWNQDVEKQNPGLFYGSSHIWYRGANAIYWIRNFNYHEKVMEDPTFYFFDSTFHLIRRVDGRRGIWDGEKWIIEHGLIMERKADETYGVQEFKEYSLDLPETPDTFVKGMKRPEEMGYWQLKRYAHAVKQEGYDNSRYLVDMNIKLSFPFIVVILTLIGIPLTLRLSIGGTPLAVSAGMAICFLYVLTLGLSRSLGLSGLLPPLFSAWLANLLFFFFGLYMIIHIE